VYKLYYPGIMRWSTNGFAKLAPDKPRTRESL